ncbi:hypothetical protein PAPYR_6739 [Paratrimastix pyriformis]|uniref:Uncharacterized protein n=1 Tax=Paratrimastix pyriformis TaxID=342808 RepID=A0ABQ8UEJ3_9EUKA|nr:hypothetical protein PAPYR_6739 [Paratrimastix pyriformis]
MGSSTTSVSDIVSTSPLCDSLGNPSLRVLTFIKNSTAFQRCASSDCSILVGLFFEGDSVPHVLSGDVFSPSDATLEFGVAFTALLRKNMTHIRRLHDRQTLDYAMRLVPTPASAADHLQIFIYPEMTVGTYSTVAGGLTLGRDLRAILADAADPAVVLFTSSSETAEEITFAVEKEFFEAIYVLFIIWAVWLFVLFGLCGACGFYNVRAARIIRGPPSLTRQKLGPGEVAMGWASKRKKAILERTTFLEDQFPSSPVILDVPTAVRWFLHQELYCPGIAAALRLPGSPWSIASEYQVHASSILGRERLLWAEHAATHTDSPTPLHQLPWFRIFLTIFGCLTLWCIAGTVLVIYMFSRAALYPFVALAILSAVASIIPCLFSPQLYPPPPDVYFAVTTHNVYLFQCHWIARPDPRAGAFTVPASALPPAGGEESSLEKGREMMLVDQPSAGPAGSAGVNSSLASASRHPSSATLDTITSSSSSSFDPAVPHVASMPLLASGRGDSTAYRRPGAGLSPRATLLEQTTTTTGSSRGPTAESTGPPNTRSSSLDYSHGRPSRLLLPPEPQNPSVPKAPSLFPGTMAGRLSFDRWRDSGLEFDDDGRTHLRAARVMKISFEAIDRMGAAKSPGTTSGLNAGVVTANSNLRLRPGAGGPSTHTLVTFSSLATPASAAHAEHVQQQQHQAGQVGIVRNPAPGDESWFDWEQLFSLSTVHAAALYRIMATVKQAHPTLNARAHRMMRYSRALAIAQKMGPVQQTPHLGTESRTPGTAMREWLSVPTAHAFDSDTASPAAAAHRQPQPFPHHMPPPGSAIIVPGPQIVDEDNIPTAFPPVLPGSSHTGLTARIASMSVLDAKPAGSKAGRVQGLNGGGHLTRRQWRLGIGWRGMEDGAERVLRSGCNMLLEASPPPSTHGQGTPRPGRCSRARKTSSNCCNRPRHDFSTISPSPSSLFSRAQSSGSLLHPVVSAPTLDRPSSVEGLGNLLAQPPAAMAAIMGGGVLHTGLIMLPPPPRPPRAQQQQPQQPQQPQPQQQAAVTLEEVQLEPLLQSRIGQTVRTSQVPLRQAVGDSGAQGLPPTPSPTPAGPPLRITAGLAAAIRQQQQQQQQQQQAATAGFLGPRHRQHSSREVQFARGPPERWRSNPPPAAGPTTQPIPLPQPTQAPPPQSAQPPQPPTVAALRAEGPGGELRRSISTGMFAGGVDTLTNSTEGGAAAGDVVMMVMPSSTDDATGGAAEFPQQ